MNSMADLRIHNFGDTANGKVSGFIPNAHVGQIGWKNINPAADLLDRLMAEKALELNQAKHALDEQKLAYVAANDEADRQHAIELEMLKRKDAKDLLKYELSLRNSYANKAKAEEDLKEKEANMYYGALTEFHDLVGDLESPQQFLKAFREHQKWLGNNKIVDFIANNGAEAAKYNNLFWQDQMKEDVVGDTMKGYSGEGKTKKINFRNKN